MFSAFKLSFTFCLANGCFLLLLPTHLCSCCSHSYLGSLTVPRGLPQTLSLAVPSCFGLNLSYVLSGHPFDFEVVPRYNWGREKFQIVEYFCLHISFFLLLSLLILLFLMSPKFPAFALSWELETYIFSFTMLKSKVLFQHVFPLDQCGYQRAVFVCTLQPKHKRPPAFFWHS